jgi:hypothetical protein
MPFRLRYDLLPEVAKPETRCVYLPKPQGGLPSGWYSFKEMFCDEPGCDCRRTLFWVDASFRDGPEAVIARGTCRRRSTAWSARNRRPSWGRAGIASIRTVVSARHVVTPRSRMKACDCPSLIPRAWVYAGTAGEAYGAHIRLRRGLRDRVVVPGEGTSRCSGAWGSTR